MKFICWNIRKKNEFYEFLADLCAAELPDILLLNESHLNPALVLRKLNAVKTRYYFIPTKATNQQIYSLIPDRFFTLLESSFRYAVFKVMPPLTRPFLFVAVHLPDKKSWLETGQKYESIAVASSVARIEDEQGIPDTVVMGDFNQNPFEEGLVSAMGFNATRHKEVANRKTRTVLGRKHRFFFNPTWKFLSYDARPPGTFYYSTAQHVSFYWYVFDQVLMRPELMKTFDDAGFEIVHRFRHHNLLNRSGTPAAAYSDHLPLKVTFRLTR